MNDPLAPPTSEFPLLETKLYAPTWRTGLVSRPRLSERLDHGSRRKLTVISAPAGFGKTTLLAEWLATSTTSERVVAWVSLSQTDNDPALFWTYVMTALQKVQPDVGKRALALLHSPQPPPVEAILTPFINEVDALKGDVSLILDDYHVIDAQPIHSAMAFLLDHLPARMHLVIATRSDPPLPLARLRGRGDLMEFGASDLRFSPAEAAAFLNATMDLALAAGDVTALEARTEGWIAGLQLAALSLQGRKDRHAFVAAFAGDDRYILDYLVEEVLQRQTEPVRNFMLQTSILDRLSGPLCNAVSGQDDGHQLLELLERANLFVVPLDDTRHWYRYHHLFAGVLRAYLTAEQPENVLLLHRRAATWFEASGMAAEAIDQAMAAGDHETVARLLVAHTGEFERTGLYVSISRWFASLPDELLQQRPRLAVIHAFAALRSDNNNRAARKLTSWAEDALDRLEQGGTFNTADDVDGTIVGPLGLDALKGEVLALNVFHSGRTLIPAEVAALTGKALELLPPDNHSLRAMLHMVLAGIQMEAGGVRSSLPVLERAVQEARRARNPALLVGILSQHGQANAALARLDASRRSFEEALAVGQVTSTEASWVMCGPHAWLAEVLLEQAEVVAAQEHVSKALELASQSPTRSYILYAWAIAAHVLLAAGDTEAALEQVGQAQAFVQGSSDARFASFMSSVTLKFLCQSGDVHAAGIVVQDRGLSPETATNADNEEEMTAYARYLIMREEAADAVHVLSRVLAVVRDRGRVQHEIHALALQALAHEQSGERTLALEALGRATMLGEPGRFHQTFTAAGRMMTGLVKALADAVRRGQGPAETASLAYLASLLHGAMVQPQTLPVALANPLTAREMEILGLIAAGMRNQEIADHLFISLSTVKRHIANAYGKLNAGHRTEAIARANELHLL